MADRIEAIRERVEGWAASGSVNGDFQLLLIELDAAREEAAALRDALRETADELDRHGWGDFHYGEQPQDPRVVAAVAKARALSGDVQS